LGTAISSVANRVGERMSGSHCRPPQDEETLERLIVTTCRAAGDPILLPACIAEVSAMLGGAAVVLTLRPPRADDLGSVIAVGIAENFVRSYAETHYLHDPWVQRLAGQPPGVAFGYELVPRWDLLRTTFYQEWIAPQDLLPDLSIAGLVLERDNQPLSTFAAFRRRGTRLFKLEDLNRLRRLLPDLQQAVRRTRAPSPELS
jgi:hypothetical protein